MDAATSEPEEEAALAALWSQNGVNYWPNGRIPVCFEPSEPGLETSQRYIDMSARIRSVAEAGYEGLPGVSISLEGWGRCASQPIGTLPGQVRVVISPNAAAQCWSGQHTGNWTTRFCPVDAKYPGTALPCSGGAGYNSTLESVVFVCGNQNVYEGFGSPHWDSAVLHEFMHVIAGAGHEMDRSDNDRSDPTCVGNGGAGPTELQFTVYDPNSITIATYCPPNKPVLSSLDILSLEMIYPSSLSLPVRAMSSLAAGSGVVIRSDSNLVSDWTYRGATTDVYLGNIGWARNGTLFTHNYALPASTLSGTSTYSGTFGDFRSRIHTMTGLTVTVSSELHTALVLTTL